MLLQITRSHCPASNTAGPKQPKKYTELLMKFVLGLFVANSCKQGDQSQGSQLLFSSWASKTFDLRLPQLNYKFWRPEGVKLLIFCYQMSKDDGKLQKKETQMFLFIIFCLGYI